MRQLWIGPHATSSCQLWYNLTTIRWIRKRVVTPSTWRQHYSYKCITIIILSGTPWSEKGFYSARLKSMTTNSIESATHAWQTTTTVSSTRCHSICSLSWKSCSHKHHLLNRSSSKRLHFPSSWTLIEKALSTSRCLSSTFNPSTIYLSNS